jgi:hypothetical protein
MARRQKGHKIVDLGGAQCFSERWHSVTAFDDLGPDLAR